MHTFIIAKLPNCILAYLQTYILAYLHASNMITSHLANSTRSSYFKLYGFHFVRHVRILEELSLLKNRAIKNQTSQTRPPSPESDSSLAGSRKARQVIACNLCLMTSQASLICLASGWAEQLSLVASSGIVSLTTIYRCRFLTI